MGLPSIKEIFSKASGGIVETISGVVDKFVQTPDEKAKVMAEAQAEINRHMEALEANTTKQLELEYQDRASARTRESEFVKATGHADYFQYFIGSIAVLLTVAIILFLLNKEVPSKNEHVTMLAIGEILGITTSIFAFYFGSSQGSRNKDRKP